MKLFERTGGHWLFWTSAIYLAIALPCALYFKEIRSELIQLVWLVVFSMPLWCNPLARWLNMKETHMFNWFKGKDKTPSNVVPFPEIPKVPYIVPPAPPEPEKPAKIFYRMGVTDNNRVAFSMGQSEITMTRLGCQQMIEQIEVFMNQLHTEAEEE